jgi:hypothetical protein
MASGMTRTLLVVVTALTLAVGALEPVMDYERR